jgi:light-regulated signal transduction histidine kinase (bacteriophytochrome)
MTQPADPRPFGAQEFHRAILNILEDGAEEHAMMGDSQRAMLNILEDYGDEKTALAQANVALKDAKRGLEARVDERTFDLREINAELESFSYSVSHDLRAPLRAIAGFSSLLARDHADDLGEEAQRKLGIIIANAMQMGELIDGVLAISRIGRQAMRSEEIDLAEVFRDSYQQLADGVSRATSIDIGEIAPCMGDHVMLWQLVTNLLSNAMKYCRDGDEVKIEVGQIEGKEPAIYFVRDHGVGFDQSYADKIFGVFERLHGRDEFEGSGIGMAIASKVVRNHGGRIWAQGALDVGATFFFTLETTTTEVPQ